MLPPNELYSSNRRLPHANPIIYLYRRSSVMTRAANKATQSIWAHQECIHSVRHEWLRACYTIYKVNKSQVHLDKSCASQGEHNLSTNDRVLLPVGYPPKELIILNLTALVHDNHSTCVRVSSEEIYLLIAGVDPRRLKHAGAQLCTTSVPHPVH